MRQTRNGGLRPSGKASGLAIAALLARSGNAADAAIGAFMTAFNEGDVKGTAATPLADVTIIDEVPPY